MNMQNCLSLAKMSLGLALSVGACLANAQVAQNQEAGWEWIAAPAGSPMQNRTFDAKTLRLLIGDLQCDASTVNGSLPSAKNEMAELLRMQSANALAWAAEAEVEFRKYQINCFCGGNPSLILDKAEKAVEMDPQSVAVHLTAAKLNYYFGYSTSAKEHLKQAAANGSSKAEVSYVEALGAQYRNDDKANIRLLAPVVGELDQAALLAQAYEKLGASYWALQQPQDAEKMLRKGAEMQACIASPQISLAEFLLYEKSDADGARNILREVMQRLPRPEVKQLLSVIDYYSWAHDVGSRKQDRVKELAQSAYASPDEVFVHAARYKSGSVLMQKLLTSSIVRDIDARDAGQNTALIMAARGDNQEGALFLISRHAAVNAENSEGQRALGFFSATGNLAAVKALLSHHANPDYVDRNGDSPLAQALRAGHEDVVQQLLTSKPTFKAVDLTALLSQASIERQQKMVAMFLLVHTNVNPANGDVMPPLIAAVLGGDQAIVRLLLKNNADINASYRGKSVLDFARATGNQDMINLVARVSG